VLTDLKIQEFLSSQRFHATRMTKGSKALRLILDTRFQDRSHQSTNLSSVPNANCCKPQRLRSLNHTSRLKTHPVSKWLMVQGLAPDLGHSLPGSEPPVHRLVICSRRQLLQTATPQELEPHFAAKDTSREQMVDGS
jgi:hypothetical protein